MTTAAARFHYGWVLVAAFLLLQMVAIGTIQYSYSIIALPFQEAFDASRVTMMLGITVMPLASALMSPFLGRAIDRYSLRAFTLLGALLLPAGFLLLSTISAMWQVPLIYALCMGYATLMLGPLGASTLLSRWFRQRLGFAMGVAAIGTSVGGFVFPPLISWLMEQHGWREGLRWLALAVAALTVPSALLLVNRPADRQLEPYGASASDGADDGAAPPAPAVFRDRNFWLLAAVLGILFGAYGAILSNLAPFAVESGVAAQRAALFIALIAVSGIVGKLGFGFVADQVDLRAALGVAVALVIAGLGCYLAGSPALIAVGCVSIGLAAGGMLPVWGAMLAWLFGVQHYGRVMGMMNLCIIPTTVLGPFVTGLLRDSTGSYFLPFALFAGLLCAALLCLPGIRRPAAAAAPSAAGA